MSVFCGFITYQKKKKQFHKITLEYRKAFCLSYDIFFFFISGKREQSYVKLQVKSSWQNVAQLLLLPWEITLLSLLWAPEEPVSVRI